MTGEHMITHRTVASAVDPAGCGSAAYRASNGRIASSIAWWPPLELPIEPTRSGRLPSSVARALSQRIA